MIPWGFVLRVVGPVVGLLVIFGWGYSVGQAGERRKATEALLKATQQARDTESQWQSNVEALNAQHQTEIDRVAAERDSAVASLRNRPAQRLPAASQPACAGASPAALAAPDAAVALGFAADHDKLRADYIECKGWIEALRR